MFSLAKVLFLVKILSLFVSLSVPLFHRPMTERTPSQLPVTKVLFDCSRHRSFFHYPRIPCRCPCVPLGPCVPATCCVFATSLANNLVPILSSRSPFLLAVLLCGIPNNARGVLGCTLRFRPRVNPRLSLSIIPNSIRVFLERLVWIVLLSHTSPSV